MTIIVKRFQKSKGAILFLEELALNTSTPIIFRGHTNAEFRLINTWHRHRGTRHESWKADIDNTLEKYKVGLEKIGVESFNHLDRFEALEHGRHHGVPTPCLDFTYSPYVALFFAFNGVKIDYSTKKNYYSVIYALNVSQLGNEWAKYKKPPKEKEDEFYDAYHEFMHPKNDFLKNGFPAHTLQFIPFPGKANVRMQRQLGALLYDTNNYEHTENRDLEEYIENIRETPEYLGSKKMPLNPTLYKIYINQKCARQVFEKLELMNITGGSLYGDADGVALDVKNVYNYNPKFSYLRDIEPPEFDETKI